MPPPKERFGIPSPYYRFAEKTRKERRHILDNEQNGYLGELLASVERRAFDLPQGTLLWRARLEHGGSKRLKHRKLAFEIPQPHRIEDMKPRRGRGREGRVNPKGMPCLYCSTDRGTAMSEVRPWIGSLITVAELMTVGQLRVVDCTLDTANTFAWFRQVPTDSFDHSKLLWSEINEAFSEPVTDSDDIAGYAPTQVVAELFRLHGFAGMQYGSRVRDGKTIALFNVEAATVVSRCVCIVTERKLAFSDSCDVVYESDHPSPKPTQLDDFWQVESVEEA